MDQQKGKQIPYWAKAMATPFFINMAITIFCSAFSWYSWVFTGHEHVLIGNHDLDSLGNMAAVDFFLALLTIPYWNYLNRKIYGTSM